MNKRYMVLAKNVSKHSDHRVKVGSVIVKKRPLSVGYNKVKTHPLHADPYNSLRGSIHAEVSALLTCDDPHGGVIYVYRETKDGKPALARPCNYCYNMLQSKGIKKVFYTISEFPYWRVEEITNV